MSTIHPPGDILFQATIATRRTKGFDQIHVFLVDQLTLNFGFFENFDFFENVDF